MRRPLPVVTGLYVPGDRPDRFDKAVATGAQLVILDLEDAVSADHKQLARDAVAAWLRGRGDQLTSPRIQVRINPGCNADLDALADLGTAFELRVPKVQTRGDVDALGQASARRPVTALIETALGVENVSAIAAHPAVTKLALGESDLASDLGTSAAPVLDYARAKVLFAALAAGLDAPMLSAFPNIRDLDGLRADTERGRNLGWVGRTAIHPSQLPVIAAVFAPGADERAWAQEVLAATDGGGVSTLRNGEMVDAAMRGRAERILALAAATRAATSQ